jgi:hypothetical protein
MIYEVQSETVQPDIIDLTLFWRVLFLWKIWKRKQVKDGQPISSKIQIVMLQ